MNEPTNEPTTVDNSAFIIGAGRPPYIENLSAICVTGGNSSRIAHICLPELDLVSTLNTAISSLYLSANARARIIW